MRAAKAAKDLQSAAGDLAERLCHAVAAEVGSFNEVLGSELPAEQQVSYSAFLTKQALPVISDLLRFLCCEQPEDPAAAVLLRLAKPRCNGLVMAELRAALREKGEPSELEEEASLRQAVPLPPGRPGSSPRRSTSRLLSRGTKRLELPVEEPARSSSGVSAGSQDSDPTLMVDKTMSLPASAHARGAARPGSFRRNERKRITTDLTQSALRGIPLSFEETVQNLRKVPLLAELTDKDMERVAEISRIQVFEQDEVMINYGAPMDTLHILLSGSANISVPQPAGTVSVGDFMGVEALQAPRTKATSQLTAGPEVRTLSIPRSAFEELNLMQRKLKREERLKASKQQTAAKKESLMTSVVSGDGRCSVTGHDLVLNYEKTEDDRQMIAKGLKSNKVLSEVLGLTHEQCEEVVNGTHLIEEWEGLRALALGSSRAFSGPGAPNRPICTSRAESWSFGRFGRFGRFGPPCSGADKWPGRRRQMASFR
ncbi:unnamed protein product [Effrenium voratum]|nr:unnamed protein product [Effrenium voratum]